MAWLDTLDWSTLIIVAVLLGGAPFVPEPHLIEKLRMLAQGTLSRPIDIFDLLMHGTPLVMLLLKFLREQQRRSSI
ncbi:MAG: RND transporter [Magnetococcales bacterium]|nr:RND transporter [Magnetococcales bacterium]